MKKTRIAHIINPFIADKKSDLVVAQPITFESMKIAREKASSQLDIELYAAYFPEDESIIPDFFNKTSPLKRSVMEFGEFKVHRKFPLLKEILDRIQNATDADYIIYSNTDISLVPEFYLEINQITKKGYDGFVVNRKTIRDTYMDISDIPQMVEEARTSGKKHPGFDCFVFKKEMIPKFKLRTGCVGANWIGRILISNILAFSKKFEIFKDLSITFHIGDDRVWMTSSFEEYNRHNEIQLRYTLDDLLDLKKVFHRKELNKIYEEISIMGNEGSPPSTPTNIARLHSPVHQLPVQAEHIYPEKFRPSSSWEIFNDQKLSQNPVFIVGYPRSGTTLVQALVASQGNIISFPETHFFSIVRKSIVIDNDRIDPDCIDRISSRIRQRVSFSKNAEEHIKSISRKGELSVKMLFETIIIDNLIGKVELDQINQIRWMEKTPDHVKFLDVIFRFYPSAKVIYVLREPGRAILSRRRNFSFNNESNWPIEQHVEGWLSGIRFIEKYKRLHPKSVKIIRLEDITKDPEQQLKKICEFLQVPFDRDRMSRHQEIAETLVYPWEQWKKKVFQKVSNDLATDIRNQLSPTERSKLQAMAGRELIRYNYVTDGNPLFQNLLIKTKNQFRKVKKKAKPFYHRTKNSIVPLFKSYKGKINLSDQLQHFYGSHRSGWIYAISCLKDFHNPRGIYTDAFIERTFAWLSSQSKPYTMPWIGFIHIPPCVPDWFQNHQSNNKIFQSELWQKSLPYCKGLYTLSHYHKTYLKKKMDVPINNLLFPTEVPDSKWTWEKFDSNRDKKIIQVGWWLRKIHAIFQLPLRSSEYRKIFLKINYFNWDDLIQTEKEILINEGTFHEKMYETAETIEFLDNKNYDQLLSENIVFLNLYDSSANNTVIECIVRNTPLLINPLPAVVEYLGKNYPFYYNSLDEAVNKVNNKDLIHRTHQYLTDHLIKEKLSGEYFSKSFQESDIYQNL